MTNSQLKKQAQKLLNKWQKTAKIGDRVKYYRFACNRHIPLEEQTK